MLMFICLPVNAVSMAAQVILSKGIATATTPEGEVRPLKRRSKIFSGDIIKTGPKGSVQVRFIDKALMTIKASTEMNIANYIMRKDGTDGEEEVLMKLVKGGFRTITGSIGKGEKSAYKVDTPAASIGIRGTNYEVQQEPSGAFVMAVYSGGISVANEAGTMDLGLGADFNFTRVSSDKPPEGLLAAPESLSVNAATEDTQEEETEEVAATTDEDSDEEAATTETEEATENEDSTDTDKGDNAPATEEQSALEGLDEGTEDANTEVATAMDQKLIEALEESAVIFENIVVDELVSKGLLQEGEGLTDLGDVAKDNLEKLGTLDQLKDALLADVDLDVDGAIEDAIADGILDGVVLDDPDPDTVVDPNPLGLFEFDNAYTGLTSSINPYPEVITDDQYNLAASEKLAMLVVPLDYSISADKRPTFSSLEPQLTSNVVIDPSAFTHDYSAAGASTSFTLEYNLLDTTTNTSTRYEFNLVIDSNITTAAQLEAAINAAIPLANVYVDGVHSSSGAPIHVLLGLLPDGTRFQFKPNSGSAEFITQMALHFQDDTSQATQALLAQLGTGTNSRDDWRAQVETELIIGTGSWDVATNTPIFTSTDQEEDNGQIYDRTQIIYKEVNTTQTVSSLAALAICGDNDIVCDIQKDNVKAGINIRWGAWLAEAGEPIAINEFSEDELGFLDLMTHEESTTLAFWVAAERADINTLTGTASFASNGLTDCTDYSQCIGFADDGGVKSVNGTFNVNFDNGAISNGVLQVQTAGSDITQADGQILSDWTVSFNGQLSAGAAEFQSSVTGGTIKDGAGNAISNNVIGNVGGIFVKPGTVFAGGYNLSTADQTNKHTAGVFTLQKNP